MCDFMFFFSKEENHRFIIDMGNMGLCLMEDREGKDPVRLLTFFHVRKVGLIVWL